MNRHLVIAVSVAVLHLAALWALQGGLMRHTADVVVPVELMSDIIAAPAPQAEVPQQPAPPPESRARPPQARPVTPAPSPVAATDSAAPAPVPDVTPPHNEAPPSAAPTATQAAAAPPAPNTPATSAPTEQPSSDARYLNNPKPAYPAISKRLGEQGKVVVRVLIETDGTAQKAEIKTSSGYDRLDQAALATVLRWRYVPGKRGGVPEAMWFNVPINFVLE